MRLSVAAFDRQFPTLRNTLEAQARRRVSTEDAEDLVCLCYQEARASLDRYDPQRSLAGWLTGILDNLLCQFQRQARRRHEALTGLSCSGADQPDTEAAERAHREAQRQRLYRRLAKVDLTARQYEVVVRTLEGHTQQVIADCLHISQRMVSYHLQAAIDRLEDTTEYDISEDAADFFHQCAYHAVYRKPHVFDNKSTSVERERRRLQ